jgi:hypothetical protein
MDDLRSKGLFSSSGEVNCSDLVKALYSNSFTKKCPKFVSHRETMLNVKLITTTLICFKRNFLNHYAIRHGLSAYTLSCRDAKQDYLHTDDDKVHKALRLINMSISEDIL